MIRKALEDCGVPQLLCMQLAYDNPLTVWAFENLIHSSSEYVGVSFRCFPLL